MILDKAKDKSDDCRAKKRKGDCKIDGCGSCEASRLFASNNKQHKIKKALLKAKGDTE
jgi:hypothetical protein